MGMMGSDRVEFDDGVKLYLLCIDMNMGMRCGVIYIIYICCFGGGDLVGVNWLRGWQDGWRGGKFLFCFVWWMEGFFVQEISIYICSERENKRGVLDEKMGGIMGRGQRRGWFFFLCWSSSVLVQGRYEGDVMYCIN